VTLNETRGHCKLKDEALDRTVRRTGCPKDYGTDLRQTDKVMKERHSAPPHREHKPAPLKYQTVNIG